MAYKAVFVRLENASLEGSLECINFKCHNRPIQKARYEGFTVACCDREACMIMAVKHVVDAMEPVEPFYYNPWGEPYFMA